LEVELRRKRRFEDICHKLTLFIEMLRAKLFNVDVASRLIGDRGIARLSVKSTGDSGREQLW
jgi:hypothetical protein